MLDVAAADVEKPGDGVGLGENGGGDPCLFEALRDPGPFRLGALAGECEVVAFDRRHRRPRPVGPDRVDGIAVERNEPAARLLGGRAEAFELRQRVEPGIVGERFARGEIRRDPVGRGLFGEVPVLIEGGVDLVGGLQRVAAVDEDRGLVAQNDREPGRPGEAREPCEPLRARRHVLALMLVGPRHDEAGDAASGEFRPERLEAPLGRRTCSSVHGAKLGLRQIEGKTGSPVRQPCTGLIAAMQHFRPCTAK